MRSISSSRIKIRSAPRNMRLMQAGTLAANKYIESLVSPLNTAGTPAIFRPSKGSHPPGGCIACCFSRL